MLGDDPPYLSVGTEVSAKYKGAFCEAKIRKVVRTVKCRVTYKQGLGTATVTDDQIKGTLRVGASVEARHHEKKDFVEATITKVQDCSQYTVVFDDGDITTLRRTALCLKSGRHFAESETLDQLPLTHPEHFGNPVIGGRRGRRSRQTQDDSSDEDDDLGRGGNDSGSGSGGKEGAETEPEIGRVVCVELMDKKKKDNWFPGLVVAPTAQDTVRIRVRDDYLVRSFKDARYYTVPKNETIEFTKELVNKVENAALKVAVEKALQFLEKNELPPHWDRDSLFGNAMSSGNSDSDAELDSDSSDNEPREEKDHFVAQLYKFMDDRGTPINNCPMIGTEDIDLYRLFRAVYKLGGYNRVSNQNQWKLITRRLGFTMQNNPSTHNQVKQAYKKFLHSFEDFYRKLGCTMVNHPRNSTRKQRPGRSLIRDKDRNTPTPSQIASVKIEKDEEEKKPTEDDSKKEKRVEIKKEPIVKEIEETIKIKKKEESEESASGHESDTNIEGEDTSSSEKSQESVARVATPSSSNGASTKSSKQIKSKEDTKKKTPERRKTEAKKIDKKDEKNKDDDTTKTRSKSKEDIAKSKQPGETKTGLGDKKSTPKPKKISDEEQKKRGRKRKEVEGDKARASEERVTESIAPSYKGPTEIGDRLKVYYGPTHESKVTYEAKVIDKENEGSESMYLVHYTGWNTRYDEWIKASRIAQNFTQSQGRMKRTKVVPRPQTPSVATASGKSVKTRDGISSRRRAQSVAPSSGATIKDSRKDERESSRDNTSATRSITSSPLTTKSPTVNRSSTRCCKNISDLSETKKQTRRTSISDDTDSCVSDEIENHSRSRFEIGKGRSRKEARRRAENRMKIDETSDGDTEKDMEEPRRGRRLRKPIAKILDIKSELESDEDQPKGRDFDLNQIRSELKGFDKAVKIDVTAGQPRQDIDDKKTVCKEESVVIETSVTSDFEKKKEPSKIENQSISPVKKEILKQEVSSNIDSNTEDIYEFKEPEPFEFEVRNKRDSGGQSDKEKTKKRVFEEELVSNKKRQKTWSATGSKIVECKNENSSAEVDKKKIKKNLNKKEDEDVVAEDKQAPIKDLEKFLPSFEIGKMDKKEVIDDVCEKTEDDKLNKTASDEESGLQKKQKLVGTLANLKLDTKIENLEIADTKKKIRKISGKKFEELNEPENENLKYHSNCSGTRLATKKDILKSKVLETSEKDSLSDEDFKLTKKRQKVIATSWKAENKQDQRKSNEFENFIDNATACSSATATSSVTATSSAANTEYTSQDHGKHFTLYSSPSKKEPTTKNQASPNLGPATSETGCNVSQTILFSFKQETGVTQDLLTSIIESKLNQPVIESKIESKSEIKTFSSVVAHQIPILAPISTRLPATSSIEEKLSAAATFRNKIKDIKKEDDSDIKKIAKEVNKKSDIAASCKKIKEDKQILKHEIEKKKSANTEPITRKETVQELEIRKDPLLAVMKQKEEELKSKKDSHNKVCATKITTPSKKSDEISLQLSKETLVSKVIRTAIDRDSIDSTDSSDSERRLTIVDNEEFQQDEIKFMQKNKDTTQQTVSCLPVPKIAKLDDERENMNSLLCEEEIPGSPTPGSEMVEQDNTQSNIKPGASGNSVDVPFIRSVGKASNQMPCNSSISSMNNNLTVGSISPLVYPTIQQQKSLVSPPPPPPPPPVVIAVQRRESNEAAPVMDNTPPTTPESTISNVSGSSRDERTVSPPTCEDSKLNQDSSEADNESAGKGPGSSEDDTCLNIETNTNAVERIETAISSKRTVESILSPQKRKKRKDSEASNSISGKKSPRQSQNKSSCRQGTGSDSDDTSENSNPCITNSSVQLDITSTVQHVNNNTDLANYSSRSTHPAKYNFYTELDPELDSNQRVNVLQQRLGDLRKTYNMVKIELAAIERRRKKLKRRERDAIKAAKAEMQQACS